MLQGRIDLLPGTTLIVSCCTYPPQLAQTRILALLAFVYVPLHSKHLQPHTSSAVMAAKLYHHIELGDPPHRRDCDGMPTLPVVAAQHHEPSLV